MLVLPCYATLNIISLVINIPSVFWHAKNKNVSVLCMSFWIILINIIFLINAFLFRGDVETVWDGAIWCDIAIKFMPAYYAGVTGSASAICRKLAIVLNSDAKNRNRQFWKRQVLIEILFGFFCPLWMVAVHIIIQPSRYLLFQDLGCFPSIDPDWVSIVLYSIWPPILSIVGAYYAVIVFSRFYKRRKSLTDTLKNNQHGSNTSRSFFIRMLLFSAIIIFAYLPVNLYVFAVNCSGTLIPFSWSQIHQWLYLPSEYSIQRVLPGMGNEVVLLLQLWMPVVTAYLLFFFFGTGRDALIMYKLWATQIGILKIVPKLRRQRSMDSFDEWLPHTTSGNIEKLSIEKSSNEYSKSSPSSLESYQEKKSQRVSSASISSSNI